ncbi:MAG: YvcK family protein [Anaerolineae bacterium]|nr:YvcK family protein [Anaerolineae bacterium]
MSLRVVAIGGGTGLSVLLYGLKRWEAEIAAVLTVGDDGGSSGRLRRELGLLPPGDFRSCLAALADDEALMTQLLQYRFGDGGLGGHALGNLLLAAMVDLTGSFEQAVLETTRVLNVRGRLLPSTLESVSVCAQVMDRDGNGDVPRTIRGESLVGAAGPGIRRVFLEPGAPAAYPGAVKAILAADLIVLGPGSLYTSVLPNLLVPGIAQAIRASGAQKVYVCNVAAQRGETHGYSVQDHATAIVDHVGPGLFQYVLANDHWPEDNRVDYIRPAADVELDQAVLCADLVDEDHPWRHHSLKLGRALADFLEVPVSEGADS